MHGDLSLSNQPPAELLKGSFDGLKVMISTYSEWNELDCILLNDCKLEPLTNSFLYSMKSYCLSWWKSYTIDWFCNDLFFFGFYTMFWFCTSSSRLWRQFFCCSLIPQSNYKAVSSWLILFITLQALQEHYGPEGAAQKGLELLITMLSKMFDSLQAAYKGSLFGFLGITNTILSWNVVVFMQMIGEKSGNLIYLISARNHLPHCRFVILFTWTLQGF
jgi:hypothetical protein